MNIEYDNKNDVLVIREFLNTEQQIWLHKKLIDSTYIAYNDPNRTEIISDMKTSITPDMNFDVNKEMEKLFIDNRDIWINNIKNYQNIGKREKIRILKRLTIPYNTMLFVKYDNNISDWKNIDRTINDDQQLMQRHRDMWSTHNITISIGHSAKFTYYTKSEEKSIIINSGDLMAFNGDILEHKIETHHTKCQKWFEIGETNNIYRYNLQFTYKKKRYNERNVSNEDDATSQIQLKIQKLSDKVNRKTQLLTEYMNFVSEEYFTKYYSQIAFRCLEDINNVLDTLFIKMANMSNIDRLLTGIAIRNKIDELQKRKKTVEEIIKGRVLENIYNKFDVGNLHYEQNNYD